jgi:hypothetical protein
MKTKYNLPVIKPGQYVVYDAGKVRVVNGSDEAFLNDPKISEEEKEKFVVDRYLAAKRAGYKGTLPQFAKEFKAPDAQQKKDLKEYEASVACGYTKPFEEYKKTVLKK